MRFIFTCLVLLGSLGCFSQLTDITKNIALNVGKLNAYIQMPKSTSKDPKPLVVVLHGCNQQAEDIALGSGWNELADFYDFYVLYPEQRSSNNVFKCFNWFLDSDSEKDKGEIATIHEMIQFVQSNYLIDLNHVYIYGVSAGAMMSVNYMVAYPENICSGAILAGGSYKQIEKPLQAFSEMKNPKDISEKVLKERLYSQNPNFQGVFPKLIVVHGTDDKVVHVDNSRLLIKQWKTAFSIQSETTELVASNKKNPSITKTEYHNENGETVITSYIAENWGHYLMIDPGKTPEQGGEITKYSLDGDFFSTYHILKDWNFLK